MTGSNNTNKHRTLSGTLLIHLILPTREGGSLSPPSPDEETEAQTAGDGTWTGEPQKARSGAVALPSFAKSH